MSYWGKIKIWSNLKSEIQIISVYKLISTESEQEEHTQRNITVNKKTPVFLNLLATKGIKIKGRYPLTS